MTSGLTISVTAETNAGGRRHMEDYLAVKLSPNEEMRQVDHLREQAYIAVFDGHGGKEAAKYARERLWDVIQAQPTFTSTDITTVCDSIKSAFLQIHREMEPIRETWKKNKYGDLSTAGTTVSTVIFRQDHIFVAHVGDSTAVIAVSNPNAGQPNQHPVLAKVLTKDHKPEDPDETRLIESYGGQVMTSRKGVPRVVWERRRSDNDSQVDMLPFLSVSRSLGDFWSYNPKTKKFVVSPTPDIKVLPLDPKVQKFVIIASDGLWNVMTPQEVIEFIWDYEHNDSETHQPKDVVRAIINECLRRWKGKNLLADNIAVLIAFLHEGHHPPISASSCSVNEAEIASSSCSSSTEAASTSTPEAGATETPPTEEPASSHAAATMTVTEISEQPSSELAPPHPTTTTTTTAEAAPTPSPETAISTEPRDHLPSSPSSSSSSSSRASKVSDSVSGSVLQSTSFQCSSSQLTTGESSTSEEMVKSFITVDVTKRARYHRKGKRSSRKRSSSKMTSQKTESVDNEPDSQSLTKEVKEDQVPAAKRTKIEPDSGCDDQKDMECDSQEEGKLLSPYQTVSPDDDSSGVFSKESLSEPAADLLCSPDSVLCGISPVVPAV